MNRNLTGDVFVDLGCIVSECLSEKTLLKQVKQVTDIYVYNWHGKIHSLFLNNPITWGNNKGKTDVQYEKTLERYNSYFSDDYETKGVCPICGKSDVNLIGVDRSNYPMTGSGEYTNFFPSAQRSCICGECLCYIYLSGIGMLKKGGSLIVPAFSSESMIIFWKEFFIKPCLNSIFANNSKNAFFEGTLLPGYSKESMVCELSHRFLQEMYKQKDTTFIKLYIFTNFAAKPWLEVYNLPFSSYRFIQNLYRYTVADEWFVYVNKFYRFKNKKKFKYINGAWLDSEGVELLSIKFKGSYNYVLYALVNEISLTKFFLKTQFKNSIILKIYMVEVLGLMEELYDIIEKIAISGLTKKEITKIRMCSTAQEFKNFITSVNKLTAAEYKQVLAVKDFHFKWQDFRNLLLLSLPEDVIDDSETIENIKISDEISDKSNTVELYQ